MTDFNETDLSFVARRYREGRYDTRKAIARFHETNKVTTPRRRWWATAAAAAASIVLVFAAGYGIRTWVRNAQEPSPVEQQLTLNPNVAETHLFVYENAPLDQVLAELSAYYGCTLTADPTDKRLTATFPDDDIELIISTIEAALQIKITLER